MNALSRFASLRLLIPALVAFTAVLWGCAAQRQGPELPEASIGIAEFTQPRTAMDMLAGYMAEDTPRVPMKILGQLDEAFSEVLRKETRRSYAPSRTYLECRDAQVPGEKRGRTAALKHWIAVGACMKVDFLLVPQITEFQEREGGEAGVTRPAGVSMDVFLLDVKNSSLTGRSHFNEIQAPLAANLLDTPKFFSRGGKWISAVELATEGMVKAVKELGL
jgi:hypothetical protein